jgi:hypothetical protein
MLWIGIWTAGVLLTGAAAIATAQTAPPKLIDVHEHFDGEPGVLQQMLIKLQAADGIGILLVTQKGFPEASKFIHATSSSTIPMPSRRLTNFIRLASAVWERLLPPRKTTTILRIGQSTTGLRSTT